MPMDFLRRIEEAQFPLEVTDPNDIRNVAVLVASGLIEAVVPPESESPTTPAVVAKITALGRAELGRLRDKRA